MTICTPPPARANTTSPIASAMNNHSGPFKCSTSESDCSWAWVTALMICPVAYGIRMPQVELMVSSAIINRYQGRYWRAKYRTKRKGVAGSAGAADARCRGTSIYMDRTAGANELVEGFEAVFF